MNATIAHAWMDDAACATTDPDAFFPEHGDTHAVNNAKRICASCEVRSQCAEYAITNRYTDGIYGGLGHRARRHIIQKRNKEAA